LVWLAEQLGDASLVSDGVRITPKKVAVWLHKLRLKLAQEAGLAVMAADGKRSRLTVSTLAGLVKQASPTLQNLSDADTDLLLSEAFKHIIGRVDTDNNVLVEGLGVFKTSEKGDKKTAKKITFHIKKT
jgi:nucleoid DNA-binding protein